MILPLPDEAFVWEETPRGPALVCKALASHARHLFTTRPWALGSSEQQLDEPGPWHEIADVMEVAPDRLVRMRQVHGAEAIEALPGAPLQSADIVVSDNADLALAVQAADCMALLIVDVQTGAAAAAHAGWRGFAAHVPERAVEAMGRTFGSRPEALMIAAGPSIGACCYEVGDDVRDTFQRAGFSAALDRWFLKTRPVSHRNPSLPDLPPSARAGRWYFDGWRSMRDQLLECGVLADRVFLPELCTASHADLLCSYRRDGAPAGRLAAVIRPARRPASE
jgi:YfiH family protein